MTLGFHISLQKPSSSQCIDDIGDHRNILCSIPQHFNETDYTQHTQSSSVDTDGRPPTPQDTIAVFIFALFTGNGLLSNLDDASGSTDLMAGKVMFLRSNQGGRLDVKRIRSGFFSIVIWSALKAGPEELSKLLFPLTSSENLSREAHSLPEVTPPSPSPLISD
ncbi:hypothetical protein TNCV_3850411 [Trichonephila clavipes]|nr:hypothetical protein TNCV_3850411 [Trichonephila clavipes]